MLKEAVIVEDRLKVHSILKAFKTDIGEVIMPQNVEGKTAQFGKDIRINADTRCILTSPINILRCGLPRA